mgnify:CR=1 FL=1
MRQKDTGTPKKKTRRAAGQMVASAVMALAIAVGGFGTTALLASQPAGLTVEPSVLLWEGETDAAHSTKKETKKNNTETPKNDSASSEAESTAASAAQPSAPSQSVKEEPAASAAPAAPAEETAAEPAAPETAPSAPMMGGIDELEQENGFPRLQQETEALAAEDPLSAPVEQDAASQPVKPLAEQLTVKFPYLTLPAMPTGAEAAAWEPILSGKAFHTRVAAKDLNLQIEEATLPNGIHLYLQPLTMEKGTVQASLIFGSGTQTYEDIDAWKPKLAQSVLQQHGVGKLTQTQTADTLGTKGIAVAESYSPDHFSISGTAQKGDLKTMLEALWTQYQQPTVDAADLTRVKESLAQSRHLLYGIASGINTQITVQGCILVTRNISLMIALSCLVYRRNRFNCFLLGHAKPFHTVLQTYLIGSIKIYLKKILLIAETVTTTAAYDNAGFLLGKILNNALLHLEKLVLHCRNTKS